MKTDAPLAMPAKQSWRVLIIDDNPDDRADLRRMLLKGSERRYSFAEAETGEAGVRAVLDAVGGPPDCVVLDYGLPDSNALDVLAAIIGSNGLTVCPVVVLTGTDSQERACKVLRAGAQDYVGKGWMTPESLTRAVENASERHHLTYELQDRERALRASEERFRLAARVAGLAVAEIDYGTDQIHLSPEAAASFGLPAEPASVPRAAVHALFHPDDRDVLAALIAASHDPAGTGEFNLEHRIVRPDGGVRWHSVRKQVFFAGGRPARALLALFDITDRKQSEEVLRQNAVLFAKIIEQAPGGVYVVDAQFRLQNVNAEALPVFASVRPLLGHDLEDAMRILWGSEVGAEVAGRFRRTLETGERYVSPRFDHQRQDIGEQQAFEWETQRITMPDGQHGVVCYFQDVTARELSASVLRASQERVRLAAEATGVGIWEWNVITNAVRWDPLMFRIYGIEPTPDGLVSYRDWSGALLPEDLAENEAVLQDSVRRRGQSTREFRIRRRSDGECRWIQAVETVRTNHEGKAEWVLGTNLDITDRKRTEEEVRRSMEEVRTLMETLPIGVLVAHDRECRSITGNAAAHALMRTSNANMSKTALSGEAPTNFRVCRNGVEIPSDRLPVQRAAKGEFVQNEEVDQIFADGTVLHTIISAAPLFDGQGEARGAVSVVVDLTQRKRIEAALQDADRRKDEFLATLAHELRNPLAPVRMAVEFLRRRGPAIPELQWAQDVIDRQTQAMSRLINDLMDLSRINVGKMQLRREHVELTKVVQGATETSRPLIEEMGHELTVTLPSGPVIVDADLTRLAQVFLNLLNNAAKYTERGGRIDLRAEVQGSDVVVSVKDTGIGIPVEKLPTIFEMFSQVEGALSRSQGGLGIGLSLAKRLVEMHGGSVEAKSEGPGKGSEFLVRLPIVVEQTSVRPASDDGDKATSTSDLRILVVDDNKDAAETLAMLLKVMGNTVHTAHDGEEAVAAAREFRPHVVLCDIGLPKLNGYEACRLMKQQTWDEKMILIAVTGWGQDDDKRKAQEAGFDHHIVKPVDPQAMLNLLAGLNTAKA